MYLSQNDPQTQTHSSDQPTSTANPAKVTARMLRIRELIEIGAYPDREELAERIIEKL